MQVLVVISKVRLMHWTGIWCLFKSFDEMKDLVQ